MKFAHLADCHLGSWKHPELQQLNMESFGFAIDKCIKEKVDFVLIAGDLFDTAIPSIDILKEATGKMRELKDNNIECYIIPGSHDFSVSGKSMIHVLEKAGICKNVTTGIETADYIIVGLGGEKRGLEIKKIKDIKPIKGKKDKLKILVLHTTLKEIGLPFIDSVSVKELPKGFDYYALGHIHKKRIFDKDNSKVVYPGALFPCNFSEIEEFGFGSFFIVNFDKNKDKKGIDLKEVPVKLKEVAVFDINADGENPKSLTDKIIEKINEDINNKIVTLRISGTLASGKPSEINFQEINNSFKEAGAFCILRNVSKVMTKEFEITDEKIRELKLETMDIAKIEEEIIQDMIKQKVIDDKDKKKVFELIECLDTEKIEGETNETFSSRLTNDVIRKLNLDFLRNID
jgi:DNA repair exonuclease SbcCD nuclease subunit